MNPSRFFIVALCPVLVAIVAIAGSCSSEESTAAQKRPVTEMDPNADPSGSGGGDADAAALDGGDLSMGDAEIPDLFRAIESLPQAFHVLITAYDIEIKEGEVGKYSGTTPPVKAFSADLVEDSKARKARVRQLAANKRITPASNRTSDMMKFESQASQSHFKNMFRNMFDTTFVSRRIDTANSMLRLIDEELTRLMTEDDDLKAELDTTRASRFSTSARAEALQGGLLDGRGGSEGMFEENDPIPEPEPEPQPRPDPARSEDGGAAP